ncbi:MAG: hypothetical protein LC808_30535, partial [Actinobacteria bacterium]|nr:hypothetical protein [Actinomycetota bacterium]
TQTVPGPDLSSYRRMHAPTGRFAIRALRADTSWYVIGFIACLFSPFFALLYIVITLFQLRHSSSGYPGVARARTALGIYAALCLVSFLLFWS